MSNDKLPAPIGYQGGFVHTPRAVVGVKNVRKLWEEMSEAEQRLIEAAPDLLHELKRTRGWVAQYLDLPGHCDAAQLKLKAIDAAIARAEGR